MNFLVPEWLLALALTLFAVDFLLLQVETVNLCGIAAVAMWVTWRLGTSWKWCILVFIVTFGILTTLYYMMLRPLIKSAAAVLQRGAPKDITDRVKGARGVVHYVAGKPFFRWNGEELLPISDENASLKEGDRVIAKNYIDGDIIVELAKLK